MGRPFVDGQRVAVEFWTTMQVGGEETTLPGCMLLAFDEDWRCRALREYSTSLPDGLSPLWGGEIEMICPT